MRQRVLILLGGLLLGVLPGTVRASKQGPVFDAYGAKFHSAFNPQRFGARFRDQTNGLLLLSQCVSAFLIIGGLLVKMRKDETQMEGIASMVLKVGFIAIVPALGARFEETGGSIAGAIGHATFSYAPAESFSTTYTPVTSNQVPKVVRKMFELSNQWTINSSPEWDLHAEASDPTQDQETWSRQAGNWAVAVVNGTTDPAKAKWATVAGSFRVAMINVIVMFMDGICTVIVSLTYFAEVLRLFLFQGGLAILPVFIAGLGVECMKNQSVRYILGLVSVGLWPIGWAMANIGTVYLINVATGNFIPNLLIATMHDTPGFFGAAVPKIAAAAPHLSWGVMALLVGLTFGLCLWMLAGLVYGPVLISRILTQGAHMIGGMVGAAAGTTTISTTTMSGGTAALLGHAMTAPAGRSSAMVGQSAASAGSAAANGASLRRRVGGSNGEAAAISMASRFTPDVIGVVEPDGGAMPAGAVGLGRTLGGNRGGALTGAAYGLEAALPCNLGHESPLASGPDRGASRRQPRPWQPLLPQPPKSN